MRTITTSLLLALIATLAIDAQTHAAVTTRELSFFGPQKYVRTTGTKDVYIANINVPPWLTSPFRLHVDNGNANGTNRASSPTININGADVLTQSDCKQHAATY